MNNIFRKIFRIFKKTLKYIGIFIYYVFGIFIYVKILYGLEPLLTWNATSFSSPKVTQRTADYIKSHKLEEYLKQGFAYCDFCGVKLFDGKEHDTQECLIERYKEVIIE